MRTEWFWSSSWIRFCLVIHIVFSLGILFTKIKKSHQFVCLYVCYAPLYQHEGAGLFSSTQIYHHSCSDPPPFYPLSFLTVNASPFFSSCFSPSHLILWISSSRAAMPWAWQALWLKGLLALCKWEADCHFEAGRVCSQPGERGPPAWKKKKKKSGVT